MKKRVFIVFSIAIILAIAFTYYLVCLGGIYKIDMNYTLRRNKNINVTNIADINKFIKSPYEYEVIINNKLGDEEYRLTDNQKLELANNLKNVELKNAIYSPGGRAIGEQYYDYLCVKNGKGFSFGLSKDNLRFSYSGSSSMLWEDIYETSEDYRNIFSTFYEYE